MLNTLKYLNFYRKFRGIKFGYRIGQIKFLFQVNFLQARKQFYIESNIYGRKKFH